MKERGNIKKLYINDKGTPISQGTSKVNLLFLAKYHNYAISLAIFFYRFSYTKCLLKSSSILMLLISFSNLCKIWPKIDVHYKPHWEAMALVFSYKTQRVILYRRQSLYKSKNSAVELLLRNIFFKCFTRWLCTFPWTIHAPWGIWCFLTWLKSHIYFLPIPCEGGVYFSIIPTPPLYYYR